MKVQISKKLVKISLLIKNPLKQLDKNVIKFVVKIIIIQPTLTPEKPFHVRVNVTSPLEKEIEDGQKLESLQKVSEMFIILQPTEMKWKISMIRQ